LLQGHDRRFITKPELPERPFGQRAHERARRYRLDALGPEHLSRFYATRLSHGMSAYAVRYARSDPPGVERGAVAWSLLARNVATAVQPPALSHHEVNPLSLDEARQLLSAAKGDGGSPDHRPRLLRLM
jgi:hypothetical protein